MRPIYIPDSGCIYNVSALILMVPVNCNFKCPCLNTPATLASGYNHFVLFSLFYFWLASFLGWTDYQKFSWLFSVNRKKKELRPRINRELCTLCTHASVNMLVNEKYTRTRSIVMHKQKLASSLKLPSDILDILNYMLFSCHIGLNKFNKHRNNIFPHPIDCWYSN